MADEEGLISVDEVFIRVEKTILLADGDRDQGNPSALTCHQSMVSLHLLRELKTQRDELVKALEDINQQWVRGDISPETMREARRLLGAVGTPVTPSAPGASAPARRPPE